MRNEPAVPPNATPPAAFAEADVGRVRSLWIDALARLVRNPGSVAGAVILLILILGAIFAPQLTRYDPVELAASERLQPPNAAHWFGTDAFGQDIYTRIVYGSRISLRMGMVSVTIAVLLGVTSGLLAGYFGGRLDTLVMRLVDITLAFPGILLALVIIAILGPSLFNAMVAVGISAAPTYARVTRGMVLKTKEEVYIESAIASGCRPVRIILRHVLPNILGPIVVVATLGVAGAIISGAALSFLGLGATPPTPEWGLMLSSGRNYLRVAWWITSFPGLAIMITVLSINLLGDGLRDALDPHMQR
jgi:peptide/nickel transport system permease protein